AGEVEAVPGSEIEYGVYGCTRGIQTRNEPETVGAGAAGQGIGAHAADERVVAGQPAQSVISGEAIDGVVGCSADKDVIARGAVDQRHESPRGYPARERPALPPVTLSADSRARAILSCSPSIADMAIPSLGFIPAAQSRARTRAQDR